MPCRSPGWPRPPRVSTPTRCTGVVGRLCGTAGVRGHPPAGRRARSRAASWPWSATSPSWPSRRRSFGRPRTQSSASLAVTGCPSRRHRSPHLPSAPTEPDPDPDSDPARERLVLDADAAQGALVQTVLRGESVLVRGRAADRARPRPSPTLLAALAGQRNSVLLVAQQRSEIDAADAPRVGRARAPGSPTSATACSTTAAPGPGRRARRGIRDATSRGPIACRSRAASSSPAANPARRTAGPRGVAARGPGPVGGQRARGPVRDERAGQPVNPRPRPGCASVARPWPGCRASGCRAGRGAGRCGRGRAWASGQADDPWYGAHINSEAEVPARRRSSPGWPTGASTAARTLDEILAESSLPPARTVADWKPPWPRWPGSATPSRSSGRRSSTCRSTSTSPRRGPGSTGRRRASSSAGGPGPASAGSRPAVAARPAAHGPARRAGPGPDPAMRLARPGRRRRAAGDLAATGRGPGRLRRAGRRPRLAR